MNDLSSDLKKWEKEHTKSKVSRRRKIIKVTAEISEVESA